MADRSIKGIAVEIRGDYRKLQADMREARKEVRASAEGMSNALNNALSPKQIESSVMSLTSNLKKIKSATSLAGDEFKNIGVDLQGMRSQLGMSEKSFASLQSRILRTKVANVNSSAIQSIARSANLGVVATANLQRKLGDTTGAFKTMSAGGVASFNRLRNSVVSFHALLAGVAVGASFKSIFEAGRSYAALNRSITSISGSTEETRRQMEFLQKTSDDLGQNFFDLATSYKSYYAAAKQANMATEEAQRIFTAFTRAGAVQGLPAEKLKYVFMAVEQMISKGTVSMEELRRQLGDNLPGALGIAADAMGVSIKQLMKMVAEGKVLTSDLLPKMVTILESRFTGGVDKATAAQNKFNESWQKAKLTMADSGFLDAAVSSLQEITEYLGSDEAQTNLQKLGEGFGTLATGAAQSAVALGQVADILSKIPKEALYALGGAAIGGKLAGKYGAMAGLAAGGIYGGFKDNEDKWSELEAEFAAYWKNIDALKSRLVEIEQIRNRIDMDPFHPNDPLKQLLSQEEQKINARIDFLKSLEADARNRDYGTGVMQPTVTGTVNPEVAPDSDKLITARNALAGLRREIELIQAKQSGSPTSALLGLDNAYAERVGKIRVELAKTTTEAGVKSILSQKLVVEKQKYDIEREYVAKRIQLEEDVKEASLAVQLDELNGVEAYEAKKAEIIAKYAQMRLQPDSQEAKTADAMQSAELAELYRERASTLAGLRGEYAQLTHNTKAYNRAMLEEIKAGITGNETLEQRLILQKQLADVQARIDGDKVYAAKQAFDEYADSAANAFENAYDAAQTFTSSTEDALVSLADGTKNVSDAFNDMANSIISDLARMAIRENITGPLYSGVSGLMSEFSFFHGGGVVGQDAPTFTRSVNPAVFSGAPRFHDGLMPDEFPAILQKGELVIPKDGVSSVNTGRESKSQQVNINFTVNAVDSQSFQEHMVKNKRLIIGMVQEATNQNRNPGPYDRRR